MHTYSILVVEDDTVTQHCLQRFLSEMGHEVAAIVSSARECFERMTDAAPDLVLMDILLDGDTDGREAAARITSEYDVPVIFLTSLSAEEVLDGEGPSAACYIQKPIHKSDLAANIQLAVMNHRMEQRLRESEKRYRSLFNNAVAGIYQATPDGRVTDVNHGFARILGYDSPAEAVDCLRDIAMQYHDAPGRWTQLVRRLETEHELVRVRSGVLGRDGDLIWVSEHLRAIPDDKGGIAFIVGVVVDITEAKEAEENLSVTLNLLHQTIDSLPAPLVLTDMEHNIILHNKPFADHFTRNGSLEGCRLADVLPDAILSQCRRAFETFALAPETPATASSPDAASTVIVSPYKGPQGDLIGALFLFRHGNLL